MEEIKENKKIILAGSVGIFFYYIYKKYWSEVFVDDRLDADKPDIDVKKDKLIIEFKAPQVERKFRVILKETDSKNCIIDEEFTVTEDNLTFYSSEYETLQYHKNYVIVLTNEKKSRTYYSHPFELEDYIKLIEQCCSLDINEYQSRSQYIQLWEEIKNFKFPPDTVFEDEKKLNIAIFGITNEGKSSFVNTVATILRNSEENIQEFSKTSEGLTEDFYRIEDITNEALTFFDSPGIQRDNKGFYKKCDEKIMEEFLIFGENAQTLEKIWENEQRKFDIENCVHCFIFIVALDPVIDETYFKSIKSIIDEITKQEHLKISPVVVLTKVDEFLEKEKDAQFRFKTEIEDNLYKLEERVKKIFDTLDKVGLYFHSDKIFLIKNPCGKSMPVELKVIESYKEKTDEEEDIVQSNYNVLNALKKAIDNGKNSISNYLKDNKIFVLMVEQCGGLEMETSFVGTLDKAYFENNTNTINNLIAELQNLLASRNEEGPLRENIIFLDKENQEIAIEERASFEISLLVVYDQKERMKCLKFKITNQ